MEALEVVVAEAGEKTGLEGLLSVVLGVLVMRGHMILLKDMLAALGCVHNIMMVLEVAEVGPLRQEQIRLLQGPPPLLEVVVLV